MRRRWRCLPRVATPRTFRERRIIFSRSTKQTNDNNQYNARMDHQLSLKDSAYARASTLNANEFDPFGSSVLNEALLPGFGRNLTTHSVNVSVGEAACFLGQRTERVAVRLSSRVGRAGRSERGNSFRLAIRAARYTDESKPILGYPQVSLSNAFTTIGSATGFTNRVDRNFEIYDNVSIQRGAHTVKFGAYFFHLNFNPSYPNDARGVYTYSGAYSGNALADFLLGYPSQAQVGIGEGAENAHTSWAHFYVEDGWKVTPSLKLDVGLRYEFNENLYARSNQTSDIDLVGAGRARICGGWKSGKPPSGSRRACGAEPDSGDFRKPASGGITAC